LFSEAVSSVRRSSEASDGRIPTLDGWRAIAIVAVMVCHSHFLFESDGPFPAPRLNAALPSFRLGVDLFFAISGYLITTLLLREVTSTGSLSLQGFYVRRAFRILPLVGAYLFAISALSILVVPIVARWEIVTTLLFCRNYFMQWTEGVATNHFWSLSIEEHFYLFWPAVLKVAGRRKSLFIAIGGALLVSIWRLIDLRTGLFHAVFHWETGTLFRTDTRCDALLWGAAAGISAPLLRAGVSKVARVPWTPLVLAAIVLWNVRALPMLMTSLAVLFALLVLSTTLRPGSPSARLLERSALTWLGKRSYSIYVWQTLFIQVPQISFSRRMMSTPAVAIASFLLDITLILSISALSYRYLELPIQRYGRQVAARLQVGAAAG
jgi:peptidoglycan/LPS O-acetylase OafA/YrhL